MTDSKPKVFVNTVRDEEYPDYFLHTVRAHEDDTVTISKADGTAYSSRMERAYREISPDSGDGYTARPR
ncbi:hypothetical protein SEA_ECLIPTUS_109 [Gordonia phage Ecliptus]|nr:hypothetical protein SEA_ECLIPTUS_109 [Gordonia phage Ecliptus]